MVRRLALLSLAIGAGAVVVPMLDRDPSPVDAVATQTIAAYEMNESSTATVLVDSSGSGLNGSIGPNVVTGATFDGATVHRFTNRSPTEPPAEPERLDTVPHSPILNPDAQDYAVTVRYRTTKHFGNLIQKGQNQSVGGYFKIELPMGRPTCMFKGYDANGNLQQRAIEPPQPTPGIPDPYDLSDNQFHTVTCERLQVGIRLYIDGVEVSRLNGSSGIIANNKNLSIAGKSSCDQIEVTCDYFVGDIDWVHLQKGTGVAANKVPDASFTRTCAVNNCTFDATKSDDPDGTIASWAWDFGDGTAGTGETTTHAYTKGGSYTATLTVTDDDGAQDSTSRTFTVASPPTTTSTTTTTTTIVAQLPPEGLTDVVDAATAVEHAVRGSAFDATETATTIGGG